MEQNTEEYMQGASLAFLNSKLLYVSAWVRALEICCELFSAIKCHLMDYDNLLQREWMVKAGRLVVRLVLLHLFSRIPLLAVCSECVHVLQEWTGRHRLWAGLTRHSSST